MVTPTASVDALGVSAGQQAAGAQRAPLAEGDGGRARGGRRGAQRRARGEARSAEGPEAPGAGSGAAPQRDSTQIADNFQGPDSVEEGRSRRLAGCTWKCWPAYPRVLMSRRQWRWAFAAQLRREADSLPPALAERMRRRAWKFVECGAYGKFRRCDDCGEIEPGTGQVFSRFPCHCLACDCCARAKAKRDSEELIASMRRVPVVEGYEWRSIVLTVRRDVSDPALHTAAALRERCIGLQEAGRRAWEEMLGPEYCLGAAMLTKPECADEGHVHLHALYYGPFVPKAKLEAIVARARPPAGCEWGFADIQRAHVDEQGLARELAKYVTKGPSAKSEDWLAGEPRWVMDPTLAARWEVAVQGIKLSRVYGALREVQDEQQQDTDEALEVPAEPEEQAPQNEYCQACCFGQLQTVILPLEPTIRAMHARGHPALHGSRWKPRPGETPAPVAPAADLPLRGPPPPRRSRSADPRAVEICAWLATQPHTAQCQCPECVQRLWSAR